MKHYSLSLDHCFEHRDERFLRSRRILNSFQFREIFQSKPYLFTKNFVLYQKFSGKPARIGIVVGKKQARRAVIRNTLKRLLRESFRCRQEILFGYDIVIRLRCVVPNNLSCLASGRKFKKSYRLEIESLFVQFLNEVRI